MEFETTSPDTLRGGTGNYLAKPGVYHLVIDEVLDGCYASGKPINGGGITLKMTALTEGEEKGKTTSLTLHMPKLTSKDKGESARKKLSAFLVATCLARPDQLGGAINANPGEAVGRQVVVDFELGEAGDDGKRYLEMRYWNFWHPDDPRAPKDRLNPAALEPVAYPTAHRRLPEYFDAILKQAPPASKAATDRKPVTADDL